MLRCQLYIVPAITARIMADVAIATASERTVAEGMADASTSGVSTEPVAVAAAAAAAPADGGATASASTAP